MFIPFWNPVACSATVTGLIARISLARRLRPMQIREEVEMACVLMIFNSLRGWCEGIIGFAVHPDQRFDIG
jgi:hypothetical protein